MFGDGYRREESLPIASDGEHLVKLGIPRVKIKKGYTFLEVPITYEEDKTLAPQSFALFEPIGLNDPERQSAFNKRATKIFDCFDLPNNFDEKNFPLWKGKTGRVVIGKDSKGFSVVKSFIKSKTVEMRQASQAQQDLLQSVIR